MNNSLGWFSFFFPRKWIRSQPYIPIILQEEKINCLYVQVWKLIEENKILQKEKGQDDNFVPI